MNTLFVALDRVLIAYIYRMRGLRRELIDVPEGIGIIRSRSS